MTFILAIKFLEAEVGRLDYEIQKWEIYANTVEGQNFHNGNAYQLYQDLKSLRYQLTETLTLIKGGEG